MSRQDHQQPEPLPDATAMVYIVDDDLSIRRSLLRQLTRLYPFMAKSFSFAGISITGLPHISFAALRFAAAADPATSG